MSEINRGHIQFLLQNDEKVGAQFVFAEALTFLERKRRLPNFFQYKLMRYLPRNCSRMVTDHNLSGLKCIRNRLGLHKIIL